jgi:hypothetical protein
MKSVRTSLSSKKIFKGRWGVQSAYLQSAINDVNKDDDQIPKLKEDGIVGPITKDVFGMTAKKKDAKQLSDSFGHFLGFD